MSRGDKQGLNGVMMKHGLALIERGYDETRISTDLTRITRIVWERVQIYVALHIFF